MYNTQDLLASIDQHRLPVLALCAFAMLGNYTFFFEAYRVSRREKIFTIPIFCTMFWFAHDLSFVYRFDIWWHQIDHWYVKAFWFALVLTVTFEAIYLRQVIRYGGKELLPAASQTGKLPRLFYQAPSTPFSWAPAQSRAPPRFA